jgi:Domain of unknown function (DUF4124)
LRTISLLTALLAIAALPCTAAVNKCTDSRGKVTYQDEPCPATPQSSKVDASNPVDARPAGATTAPQRTITKSLQAGDEAEYRSAKGTWRGPAQFQLSVGGVRSADAHAIGRMVIELQSDGRVRGVIDEAGCKLNGLHTQFASPAGASIDVTVSGCQDDRFNTRYSGLLVGSAAARESKLQLSATATRLIPGQVTRAAIDAVLRR